MYYKLPSETLEQVKQFTYDIYMLQYNLPIIINDETLEKFSQFTYLFCSISYQFSNDVEVKLAKFLQLIGTIKKTNFKKLGTETILKIYNTLILPTFLYGSENWTLPYKDEELKRQK